METFWETALHLSLTLHPLPFHMYDPKSALLNILYSHLYLRIQPAIASTPSIRFHMAASPLGRCWILGITAKRTVTKEHLQTHLTLCLGRHWPSLLETGCLFVTAAHSTYFLTSILREARSPCHERAAGAEMYRGNHLLTFTTGRLPWESDGRVKPPHLLSCLLSVSFFFHLAIEQNFYKLNVGVV